MNLHVSTFWVDGLYFGVEVGRVQEVLRYQPMTQVPLAAPVVRGLINLRGQIVMAVDMRRRLELSERAKEQLPMNVIIRSDDGAMSLLVDEIGEVLDVAQTCLEPPPETLQGLRRALIKGVCKLDGRLLLLLDCDKLINIGSPWLVAPAAVPLSDPTVSRDQREAN